MSFRIFFLPNPLHFRHLSFSLSFSFLFSFSPLILLSTRLSLFLSFTPSLKRSARHYLPPSPLLPLQCSIFPPTDFSHIFKFRKRSVFRVANSKIFFFFLTFGLPNHVAFIRGYALSLLAMISFAFFFFFFFFRYQRGRTGIRAVTIGIEVAENILC